MQNAFRIPVGNTFISGIVTKTLWEAASRQYRDYRAQSRKLLLAMKLTRIAHDSICFPG